MEESGISTKQVLGYMWPVALLKKHERQVPAAKKLQTIQHQGKPVKGLILEEWVIGALDSKKGLHIPKNLDALVGIWRDSGSDRGVL